MEGNLDIYYPFSFLFSKIISIWYLIIILLYPPLKVTIVFSGIVVCLYVKTSFPLLCVCVFLKKKKKLLYLLYHTILQHTQHPKL